MSRLLLIACLLVPSMPFAASPTPPPSPPAELLVHAAASLGDVLAKLARLHEERTGTRVTLSFGASNVLARQIVAGAPGDLFFSADDAQMDVVERADLLVEGTRRSVLSNSLVVVVPVGSTLPIVASADLALPIVKRVALADPAAVPAGVYAKAHLERIGAWDAVLPKVVPTENVRAALAAAASGNVDAAIVYATDARASKDVRVAHAIPSSQAPDIVLPVAVLAGSTRREAALELARFLASSEASAVFEEHGFVVRR